MTKFELYLKGLYAKFDFKVNKCKVECIEGAQNYVEVGKCEEKCESGVIKFSNNIDNRLL